MNLKINTILITLMALTCVLAESEDVYNTAKISSDLNWRAPTNDNEWSEQSSGGSDGNVVRTLEICNAEGGMDEEHWLRSPYINARSANRLYLEIDFSITKCQNCRETFTLYRYVANSDEATSTFPPWQEGLYRKIDTLAAHKQFDGKSVGADAMNRKTYPIDLRGRKGIYLAIHTEGPSCMSIAKVRLYYHFCPQVSRQLTEFPRTVAGAGPASLVSVEGKCAANSVPQNNNDHLRIYCNADGVWLLFTGGCACDRGYTFVDGGGCGACPAHKYKWTTGNGTCVDCPAHSTARSPGTASCECDSDYFRADDDPADRACTRIPSAPVDLNYKLTRSGVQIVWEPPREDGGRMDLYYNLTCHVCDEMYVECKKCPDTVQFFPKNYDRIEATDVLMSDLDQVSFYKIKIHSYNGVSQKSGKTANYAETHFSTSDSVPSAVKDVVVGDESPNSLSLYWSEPDRQNAVILDYQVQLQPLTPAGQPSTDDPPFTLTILRNNSKILGLKPGTSYRVCMRARTSVGHGLYSDPKIFTTPQEEVEEGSAGAMIAVVAVVVVAAIAAAVFFLRRRRSRKLQQRQNANVENKLNELNGRRLTPASRRAAAGKTYVDYRDPHKGVKEIANEIELSKIKIHSVIGQGEFGEVWKGALVESKKKKPLDVAVKRLKDGASIVDQTNFLREACTIAQFHDPNIVELKGVVTKHMPAMIVTEYMENGSLDKYLQKRKGELSVIDLLKMQRGIASGMKYLANMKYVHRDLAARNILIDSKHCCKVSDFGLSRTLENDPNATYTAQGGKIALRWTAPECIRYRKFTSASDVWSYGIVMWEVMSYGEKPYWDMNNEGVQKMIEDGYRLPCPEECPRILHDLMLACWSADSQRRPPFAEILSILDSYIAKPSLLKPPVMRQYLTPEPSSSSSLQHLLSNCDHSDESLNEVSTLEEWLDMVSLGSYGRSFYANGINDLQALTNITASDLERLGIVTPEHRNRLESGIDTLRRHLNQSQRRSATAAATGHGQAGVEEAAITFTPQPSRTSIAAASVSIPLEPLQSVPLGVAQEHARYQQQPQHSNIALV